MDDVPTGALETIDAATSHAMSATMFVADFASTFQLPLGLQRPVSFQTAAGGNHGRGAAGWPGGPVGALRGPHALPAQRAPSDPVLVLSLYARLQIAPAGPV